MSYQIAWDEQAREFLRKIHKPDAQRIIRKVNSIIEDPFHFLERLVEISGYKLRIGDYRALIDVHEENNSISVVYIGHRKDIYQYLQRTGFRAKN
ncbi:type II toxin-antitoxin system RelE/ParE family toxin [Candidatus Woesearchaeota archaeon]|nr:type II toxin-antitoxin system RelE/ParE family toxin [Candidatus Woesearchaeota archaeon]